MDLAPVIHFALLLVRISTLVATTPILGGSFAPPTVKIGLAVLLTLVLLPVVSIPASLTGGTLVIIVVREFAIGFALALGIRALIAAAELGGYLIGFQLGFSYAGIVDPQSGVRNNLLAALYASLTVMTLVTINAHHAIIRALVVSYQALPLGTGALHASVVGAITALLGMIFYVGIQVALPVVLVLCIVELVLGIISRATPSLNLMVVGAPARLLIGLATLITTIQILPSLVGPLSQRAVELAMRLAAGLR
jgi:flagellar biosynthetic protein FliR